MTEQTRDLTVRRAITVKAPQDRAFEVFVDEFATWWPKEHHIGAETPETVIVEAHTGGRCFERAPDGTECDWGRVTAHEPPGRLVIAWELDADFEHDPASATEVEVRFISEGPSTTRVELEHRVSRSSPSGRRSWPGRSAGHRAGRASWSATRRPPRLASDRIVGTPTRVGPGVIVPLCAAGYHPPP